MSSTTGAPQQHKQPSRKSKRAWRKNVDISEVQDGLEALREEIVQGGPIAEKHSEELFIFDTAGSQDITKKHHLRKPLKADEILAQRSAVPAVDSRKRAISRTTDGILERSSKRQRQDWVSKKEVQRMRNDINNQSQLSTHRLEEDGSTEFDLWSTDVSSTVIPSKQDEYIPKARAKVAPQTIRRAPIPMTASGKAVRAIRNPDAGASYNPAFEDWDDLLNKEGQKEVEAEKAKLQREEEEAERQARIAAASAQEDTGTRTDDESAWEGFETENEDPEVLKRKRPERKTPAQRNKIKRRREAEKLANHQKAVGKKQKQVELALATMAKSSDLMAAGEAADAGSDTSDDTRLRRRRMGNAPIPEKPLEVVLPDELQESLRRLRPEGNLMTDRFRNLLVNGKIESRKPVLQPRKKQRTFTEKWSHKDFSVQV